jgi:endogenous inhibitor of DNA gyrase (YacG/DUF329 family)
MKKPLMVKCPGCGAEVAWQESSEFRPFCSASCRNRDFIGWASEEHRLGGDDTYDDLLSGELLPRD